MPASHSAAPASDQSSWSSDRSAIRCTAARASSCSPATAAPCAATQAVTSFGNHFAGEPPAAATTSAAAHAHAASGASTVPSSCTAANAARTTESSDDSSSSQTQSSASSFSKLRAPQAPIPRDYGRVVTNVEWDPSAYLGQMLDEIPGYAELEDAVAAEASGKTILELGTGTGETALRVLARNRGARLTGIDASEAMLAAARAR